MVLGGGFRLVSKLLTAFQVKSDCYGIQRGQNQPPINTCKGILINCCENKACTICHMCVLRFISYCVIAARVCNVPTSL